MVSKKDKDDIQESYFNDSKEVALKKYPQLNMVYKIVSKATAYASDNDFNIENATRFISIVEYKVFKKLFSDESLKEIKKKEVHEKEPLEPEEIELWNDKAEQWNEE